MSQIIIDDQKNQPYLVGIIFIIIILAVYTPVVFLDQTFLINTTISPEYIGNQKKSTLFGIVADSGMNGEWPDRKVASKMILEGKLPLWNPYVGLGYPLGADTTDNIFTPTSLGFLLPVEYWDIPLLIAIWIAGVTTFYFLKNLGLNFTSSLSGGIFFMLSGGFTWFMSQPGPFVLMITPLILLSIDKICKNKNPKYIIFLSLSFGFSILGGHLQTMFLQFVLIIFYSGYRIFTLNIKTNQELKYKKIKFNVVTKTKKLFKIILGLIGGIGLSAFFIFYVLEYIKNGILDESIHYDKILYNVITLPTLVMPNILGNITRTWTTNVEWASYGVGYSGVFVLFFTVLSIFNIKNKNDAERWTPIFFLIIAVLAFMRLVNVPIISLVHTLPVFNLISFGHYSAVLITFGLSISAAFGVNYLSRMDFSKKKVLQVGIISLFIILGLLIPIGIEVFSGQNMSKVISLNDVHNYIIFQIAQAIFFLSIAIIISMIIIKRKYLLNILPYFFILELSLYLPFGLHPISIAYKFLIIALSVITILLFSILIKFNSLKTKKYFWFFVIILITSVFLGHTLISEKSTFGMPTRFNYYEDNKITEFLKENLGQQRIFSFEKTLRADYNAAYDISSIGIHSSFNVNDYHVFSKKFLDNELRPLGLGSDPWSLIYGPEKSISKFLDSKKYFDFLGVKYIITEGYNFNTISYGESGTSGNFVTLGSKNDGFYQIFTSPIESIETFGIYLFANSVEEDYIVLNLDSIPYEEDNHRDIKLSKIKNAVQNEFKIEPPIKNALNKQFKFSLSYPKTSNEKYGVIYYADKKTYGISNEIMYYIFDKENKDIFLPFTITPIEKKYPIAFNFYDIYINENLDAFPRAYLVHDFITVPVNTAQDYLDKNNDFDLRNSVVLEISPDENKLNNLKSKSYDSDTVNIVEFNENNIEIQTFSESESILILTDVYYPGWEVSIDGKPAEILRANGLVRAVILEEGNHVIEFDYVPKSFWNGIGISILTAIGLFGVYLYSKKYKKISLSNEN